LLAGFFNSAERITLVQPHFSERSSHATTHLDAVASGKRAPRKLNSVILDNSGILSGFPNHDFVARLQCFAGTQLASLPASNLPGLVKASLKSLEEVNRGLNALNTELNQLDSGLKMGTAISTNLRNSHLEVLLAVSKALLKENQEILRHGIFRDSHDAAS
jgi:hypothetical protein